MGAEQPRRPKKAVGARAHEHGKPQWACRLDAIAVSSLGPGRQVLPANRSMFKSALFGTAKAPEMKGLSALTNLESALDQDAVRQTRKYGCSPDSQMVPNVGSARFNVKLPFGSQSLKYSWRGKSPTPGFTSASPDPTCSTRATPLPWASSCPDPRSPTPSTLGAASPTPGLPAIDVGGEMGMGGVRFNMARLASWFKVIDRDGSGSISQREFIVHLRRTPELLQLFLRISKVDRTAQPATDRSLTQVHRDEAEMETERVSEQIAKIKEILREVAGDGSDEIGWNEFVDFFRKSNLLLEYRTKLELNRTKLCVLNEAALKADGQ